MKLTGKKLGYVFKTDGQVLGYYKDAIEIGNIYIFNEDIKLKYN